MRAYSHRLKVFFIQSFVIVLLAFGLSFSAGRSLAQEATTDAPTPTDTASVAPTDLPTVVPTDAPTEVPRTAEPTDIPTVAPTEEVTQEPTSESTEVVTDQPSEVPTDATTEQPTSAPTENATQPPATEVSPDVFTADFQDGDTSAWLLTPGWAVTDDAGNNVLAASTANEMATLTGMSWPYFSMTFRVRGDLQVNMSSGGSAYQIQIVADGSASLYKDGTLIGEAAGETPTDATEEPSANWHTVNLLAPGNLLAVKVDNFTPVSISDATLVGMGPIMFGTSADNVANVAFDDVSITRLDAPPPSPTAVPTSVVVPIPPPTNVTEEPTVEATIEPTTEATVEATTEATEEATAEATSEATAEATVEATPEATVDPTILSDAAKQKLPPELIDILQTYLSGNVDDAKAAAADYFIQTDQQQRINVTVWTSSEKAAAVTAANIVTSNGLVTDIGGVRLQAAVTLDEIIALANIPDVNLIEVPPRAVSTSDMAAPAPSGFGTGSQISEGVDTTGAAAWQNAGIKGAGVNIALIDTGFGPSVVSGGEYACLGNTSLSFGSRVASPADTTHGLEMVQVLCDMAPAAKVYMYKATNASTLQSAITAASGASPNNKVIVIAMDLGASVSPGDGTGGGASFANGLYTAIHDARAAGKIVIASAGNNTGRYVTLNYSGANASLGMTLYAGDVVHVSWDDWSGNTKNVPSNLTGTFTGSKARLAAAPSYAYTVPAGTCASGCSNEVLTFPAGGSTATVQVQIAGQGTIDDTSSAPVDNNAGNIARPADSPDVLTVGAVVCLSTDTDAHLTLDDFSSHGPTFASGGTVPAPQASYLRDQVKPDLTSLSHVSTSFNNVNGNCSSGGLSGTSAAAAHVAGMAALLLSNASMTSTFFTNTNVNVDAVKNYLQTHTMDSLDSGYATAYDQYYGAGYTILGSPSYDLSQINSATVDVNQLPAICSATPKMIYVGLNNPGGSQSGTLTNPYMDINQALAAALPNQCVVMLPGEYVASIAPKSTTQAAGVLSYQSAASFPAYASNLWSIFVAPIFASSASNILIEGFTAQSAYVLTYSDGTSIRTPAFRFRSSSGSTLQTITFTGYRAPGTTNGGANIQIKGSTFSNFAIPIKLANGFNSPASRSAAVDVTNTTSVVISNNIFQNNTIPNIASSGSDILPWQPAIVGINHSAADIFNNKFEQNTSATIIGVNQRLDPSSSVSELSTAEIRVFGNLIDTNAIKGPLLHLEAAPNLRFVNNSVVNNTVILDPDNSVYNGYFVYGRSDTGNGAYFSGHNLEIHNNIFYNNGSLSRGFVTTADSSGWTCFSIQNGGANKAVRNNWFSPAVLDLGDCNGHTANTVTDTINPTTVFFGTSADPSDPFRLRPNTNASAIGGINSGDDTAVTDIFGSFTGVTDVIGAPRQILGRNDNLTYQNKTSVDIGAYELGIATPPTVSDINQTINEDSATNIVFHLTASGGYSQSFSITTPPTVYDTKKTNVCGGKPFVFTLPNTVTYCPPANFHTLYGVGSTNVPVKIGFSVEDKVGNPGLPSSAFINITINPVNDNAPTPAPFSKITDYGTPINYQLGPVATFTPNFSLVKPSNGLDYPVKFTYIGQDTSGTAAQNPNLLDANGQTTDQILTAAFAAANTNGGHLIINPVGGQKGLYKFTYDVEDLDHQHGVGTGSIIVVPAVAGDGHYDDDSFFVTYTGTWTPTYAVPVAYNHTLHVTKTLGSQLEFPFSGTVASLNMLGINTPGNTSLKVEFNLDVSDSNSPWLSYTDAQTALPSLSCVNTLNNQAPTNDSDANPINRSKITNYSAASAAYKLICSGFPTGTVQSIRLTNNIANATMRLDSMDVGSGIFSPGLYQQDDINITYVGAGWKKQVIANALGGSRTYAAGSTNSYNFQIQGADRFALYTSPGPTGSSLMKVCIAPTNDPLNPTCDTRSDFHAGTMLWKQQQVFEGLDSELAYTVTVTNESTVATQTIDLDAVQVFAPTAPLTPSDTVYQQDDPNITYSGSGWITQTVAVASGGSRTYAAGATNSYSFQVANATRFTLYTSTGPTGGTMQVCISPTPAGLSSCNNRSDNSSVALWQQKLLFGGLDANTLYTVTVTNVSTKATQVIDLDAILVFGTPTPFDQLGLYQQEDPRISYIGSGWKLSATALAYGSSMRYSYTVGDSYSFQVANAGRVVLYTSPAPTGGTMQVCISPLPPNVSQSCTTRSENNNVAVYRQPQVFTGLDTGTTYTFTVTNVTSPATPAKYIDLDAIEVLPDVVPLTPSATLYQENDTNIIYNGFGWKVLNTTLASNKSHRSSAVLGNSYTFQVQGADRFVLYVSPLATGGTMSVSCIPLVAGVPTGSSECTPSSASINAPAAQWQQPRYFTGLNDTKTYQVTVTSTLAGKSINLDAIEVDAPLDPLTPAIGYYEQTDVNIRYVGAGWKPLSNVNASSGNLKRTFGIGNSYSFEVTNATRFSLYTSAATTGGTMSLICDNLTTPANTCTLGTASEYATVALWKQQHLFTGLTPSDTYLITVTNTSNVASKYIDLDAIEVLNGVAPLTPGFYQQDDADIDYTGTGWNTLASVSASGGNFKRNPGIGNGYNFQVTGAERFILFVNPGAAGGIMKVCIVPTPTGMNSDCNDPSNSYSEYAAVAQWQQPRYFTGLDKNTVYTVTVTNASTVANKYIDLDAVQVDAPLDPLIPSALLYQQSDERIQFTGTGWKTVTNAASLGGSYKTTFGIGNSYQFKVKNADRFVLYTSPNTTGGTMQVCIEPTPTGGVDCPDASNNRSDYAGGAQWQQPRFFGGLTPGVTYTVTVTNASPAPPAAAKFIDLEAIEVLAPASALDASGTLYQENDPNIAYSGTGWARGLTTLASNSNFRSTTNVGDSYTFTVDNADRFALLVSTGATGGLMNVCIQPTPTGMNSDCNDPSNTYNLYTAGALYQQPRYFEGLDSGTPYTVTVTNASTTAKKLITIDAIQVDAPLTPLEPQANFYQQDDPNIRYTGLGWKNLTNVKASNSGYRSTTVLNSSYTFLVKDADRFVLYVSPNVGAGTMQVCVTDVTTSTDVSCTNSSEYSASVLWQQPRFFDTLPNSAHTYRITVKNTVGGKYIDLDAIQVLAPAVPLTPSATLYEETDPNITYSGKGWISPVANLASNSSIRRTTLAADSITFQIQGASQFALVTAPGPTGGMMSVTCVQLVGGVPTGSSVCTPATMSNNAPALRWQQGHVFSGLTPANTYVVTITKSSTVATQYIDLDAIQVGNAPLTLQPGWYQDWDLNLTYTGTWTQDAQNGISAGQSTFTKTSGDDMQFSFTGTGFTIFTTNPSNGALMEICYKLSTDSTFTLCTTTPTNAAPTQAGVGTAVYGLKHGDYDVRVRHVGTATQVLYIDRIAVLDTPADVLGAGIYENNDARIVYSPAPLWTTPVNAVYSGSSITMSPNKGATAQFNFTGTTLIIYQVVGPTYSRNVLLCRVLESPITNPDPQCGSFSQNNPGIGYKIPIAFYGFGTGTNEVVIENRSQGTPFNIDKIMVN